MNRRQLTGGAGLVFFVGAHGLCLAGETNALPLVKDLGKSLSLMPSTATTAASLTVSVELNVAVPNMTAGPALDATPWGLAEDLVAKSAFKKNSEA